LHLLDLSPIVIDFSLARLLLFSRASTWLFFSP
jgi:hypothetical protein